MEMKIKSQYVSFINTIKDLKPFFLELLFRSWDFLEIIFSAHLGTGVAGPTWYSRIATTVLYILIFY